MSEKVPWLQLPRAKALDDLHRYCRALTEPLVAEDLQALSWQRSDARSIAQRELLADNRLATYVLSSHAMQRAYRFEQPPLMLTDAVLGLVAGDKILPVAEQILVEPIEQATGITLRKVAL